MGQGRINVCVYVHVLRVLAANSGTSRVEVNASSAAYALATGHAHTHAHGHDTGGSRTC